MPERRTDVGRRKFIGIALGAATVAGVAVIGTIYEGTLVSRKDQDNAAQPTQPSLSYLDVWPTARDRNLGFFRSYLSQAGIIFNPIYDGSKIRQAMQFSTEKPPVPTNDPNDRWSQAERNISENTFSPFALKALLREYNGLYIYDATQGDSAMIYYGTSLTQG